MRSKPFKRAMRRKYISHRKRIARKLYGKYFEIIDGEYDKGKVHCSCPMCSRKTNNKGKNRLKHGNYYPSKDWKHSDKQKLDSMDAAIADYESEIADLSD